MAELIVNREGPVTRLKLNRPERRNALNYALIDQLLASLKIAANDDKCRVVMLSGEGSGFCSGDDLHGMGEFDSLRWQSTRGPQHALIDSLRRLPKPIVVSIHGYAYGIGLDMALACDIRICSQTAILCDPRVERALYAATGITYQLPRIVGYGKAMEMMLLSERLSGREAAQIGLVYKAVPEKDLTNTVEDIVAKLAQSATKSIAVIKEQMRAQLDMSYENATAHSDSVITSYKIEDLQEGIKAFLEKRPAKFTGK